MPHYRCYFLDGGRPDDGSRYPFVGAENLDADSDAEARGKAEALYRARNGHGQGFELWQAGRLVFCRAGPSAVPDAPGPEC